MCSHVPNKGKQGGLARQVAILAHVSGANELMDGEIELGECYFDRRRKGNLGRQVGSYLAK